MLNLAVAIQVPNIQKMRVVSVRLDGDLNTATVIVAVQGGGGFTYGTYELIISDNTSVGLRATAQPIGYADQVQLFSVPSAGAFTALVTAYTGGIGARNKAAESALQLAGLLPPGVVT